MPQQGWVSNAIPKSDSTLTICLVTIPPACEFRASHQGSSTAALGGHHGSSADEDSIDNRLYHTTPLICWCWRIVGLVSTNHGHISAPGIAEYGFCAGHDHQHRRPPQYPKCEAGLFFTGRVQVGAFGRGSKTKQRI